MAEVLNNRAVIGIIGAAVGFLITGLVNFVLQWFQDKRRFEQQRQAQREQWDQEAKERRERWEQEDELQRQQWNREDELRNYDERREAYIEVLQATDLQAVRRMVQELKRKERNEQEVYDHSIKHSAVASELRGKLRMLAPIEVRATGEYVIQRY